MNAGRTTTRGYQLFPRFLRVYLPRWRNNAKYFALSLSLSFSGCARFKARPRRPIRRVLHDDTAPAIKRFGNIPEGSRVIIAILMETHHEDIMYYFIWWPGRWLRFIITCRVVFNTARPPTMRIHTQIYTCTLCTCIGIITVIKNTFIPPPSSSRSPQISLLHISRTVHRATRDSGRPRWYYFLLAIRDPSAKMNRACFCEYTGWYYTCIPFSY